MSSKSSRSRQQYLEVIKLVKLVQQPLDDAAAAKQLIKGVEDGLNHRQVTGLAKQRFKGKAAAQLSACVAAALQCAGWLVAARGVNQEAAAGVWAVVNKSTLFTRGALEHVAIGSELLQAVLRPAAGSHVPGLTTWLPQVAAELFQEPGVCLGPPIAAVPAARPPAPGGSSNWLMTEELLVYVWNAFYRAWGQEPTPLVEPASWMHPAVLQLTDKLLKDQVFLVNRLNLLHVLVSGAAAGGTSPLAHPQLAAAAGGQLDAGRGEQVAAAVQQVCWWQALASFCEVLAAEGAATAAEVKQLVAGTLHVSYPSDFCPPYYSGNVYAGQLPAELLRESQVLATAQVLHVLLVGQLWDVWPWQLQQLQQSGDAEQDTITSASPALSLESSGGGGSTGSSGNTCSKGSGSSNSSSDGTSGSTTSSSTPSSSGGIVGSGATGAGGATMNSTDGSSSCNVDGRLSCEGGGGNSGHSSSSSGSQDQTIQAPVAAMSARPSSSSSSSEAGAAPSERAAPVQPPCLADDEGPWRSLLKHAAMAIDWPWLPSTEGEGACSMQPGGQKQAVTLQQLQLAVCGLAHANVTGAPTAALLLAVLLQRADSGLRAEFLGGAGGTTLLGACQYWGVHHPGQSVAGCREPPFSFYEDDSGYKGMTAARLLAVLDGDTLDTEPDWQLLQPGNSLALLLAWCYLQPGLDGEEASGVCSSGSQHHSMVTTPYHHSCALRTGASASECLLLHEAPSTTLCFAPGCVPTPLLVGTLEALLRGNHLVDNVVLLRCTAVFVHATAMWLMEQPADSSGVQGLEPHRASTQGQTSSGSGNRGNGGSSGGGGSSSSYDQHVSSSSGSGGADGSASSSSGDRASISCNNSSNTSSSSMVPGAGHGELLRALASLAVTFSATLAPIPKALTARRGQELGPLHTIARCVLPGCCLVAGELLHLAAQQLAVPGTQALPALQLAAAAQRLAGVCAELAAACRTEVTYALRQHAAAQGYAVPADSDEPLPPPPKALSMQGHTEALRSWAATDAPCQFLAKQVGALLQVQTPWQQGAGQQQQQQEEEEEEKQQPLLQQDDLQPAANPGADMVPGSSSSSSPKTDVPECGDGAACHNPAGPSSTHAVTATTNSAPVSSGSSSSVGFKHSMRLVMSTDMVQHACRPRVQLVGCSNLSCSRLSGPTSAEGLVAGRKGVRCSGCRVARYCSPACQKEDWEQHRHVCRRLAAAGLKLGW